MGRFFCCLALCALLAGCAGADRQRDAQPVFFSLLFPQLMPGYEQTATPAEAWGEAILL